MINDEAAFITREHEEFYGTVVLLNAMPTPWADMLVDGVTGHITVIASKDLVGIEAPPTSRDASWAILVTGKQVTMGVPGCQVRYIIRQNDEALAFNVNPHFIKLP